EDAAAVVAPEDTADVQGAVEAQARRLLPIADLLRRSGGLQLLEARTGSCECLFGVSRPLLGSLGSLHRRSGGPDQVRGGVVVARSRRRDEALRGPRRCRSQREQLAPCDA